MKKFEGFSPRNNLLTHYTPVHNIFFDEILERLTSLGELKVILSIYRNTFGVVEDVNEKGEQIFRENYFVTIRQLAKETELTEASVVEGLKRLIESGYVERTVVNSKKMGYKLKIEPTQESNTDLPKNLG